MRFIVAYASLCSAYNYQMRPGFDNASQDHNSDLFVSANKEPGATSTIDLPMPLDGLFRMISITDMWHLPLRITKANQRTHTILRSPEWIGISPGRFYVDLLIDNRIQKTVISRKDMVCIYLSTFSMS